MPVNIRVVVLVSALILVVGCSGGKGGGENKGPTREDELREVGEMLTLLSGETKRGYTKLADLSRYEPGYVLGYQAVKSGSIVIVKGATMPGEGDKTGTDAIVAHEKDAATQGGWVLLHNRTIKQLTAAEFQAAAKAAK